MSGGIARLHLILRRGGPRRRKKRRRYETGATPCAFNVYYKEFWFEMLAAEIPRPKGCI